jgi:hypothetical protein
MSRHTPGPWIYHWDGEGGAFVSGGGTAIADTVGPTECRKANARLIAAAPEMLEALDIVVGCLLWNKQDEASIEVMRRVNSVRAKAEGLS